jgi:hypothetical protein
MTTTVDWQSRLVDFLVEGGIPGYKWSDIMAKFDAYATAPMLEAELNFLAADDKVQKFKVPAMGRRGGRGYTVWRATTRIMEHMS